jgi:hypothetical protein
MLKKEIIFREYKSNQQILIDVVSRKRHQIPSDILESLVKLIQRC